MLIVVWFSTLICVFTLDRIGRRCTLYWGSVGQAIAMFLAGGFSRIGIDATAAGDASRASMFGNAAVAMVFLFTFVFGATWLTGKSSIDIGRSKTLLTLASTVAISSRGVSPGDPSKGKCLGSRWLECRKRLAHTALPRHVQRHRRENALHFRRLQHHHYPYGLGTLPRD
jgi:hypothetical protein